jgi:hypothetical protein
LPPPCRLDIIVDLELLLYVLMYFAWRTKTLLIHS